MKYSDIVTAITNAEFELNDCFNYLMTFKHSEFDNADPILLFQPKLANCLYELMKVYRCICKEEQVLISEKGIYVATDFSNMMVECSKYKEAIKVVIDIGKALGDGFAWYFYQNSLDELNKQFDHHYNGLFPTGVGGKGEIEFIRNNQNLGGYFTLYHSITNMLRVGDFSLCTIDGKLVGIGELKSERQDNILHVSAYITSKVDINVTNNDFEKSNKAVAPNPDRLRRQLQQQENFFKKDKLDGSKTNIFIDYQYDLIEKALSSEDMVSISDDNSMFILLTREAGDLSTILLNEHKIQDSYEKVIQKAAQAIIIENCAYNSFHLCEIDLKMTPFRKPIIWWRLKDDIIKQIIFKQLHVATVVNMGYFYDRLERMGYAVEESDTTAKNGIYRISKNAGSGVSKFIEPTMLTDLIYHDFSRIDTIIATIDRCTKEAIKLGKSNIKMELHLHQHTFGKPQASS